MIKIGEQTYLMEECVEDLIELSAPCKVREHGQKTKL